jgi:hypothetical protein
MLARFLDVELKEVFAFEDRDIGFLPCLESSMFAPPWKDTEALTCERVSDGVILGVVVPEDGFLKKLSGLWIDPEAAKGFMLFRELFNEAREESKIEL